MREKLAKLIDVKSIVTMVLVITLVVVILCNLPIKENVFQLFSSAVMLVLGFFFGKKTSKEGE
jgi:hypothetical protein